MTDAANAFPGHAGPSSFASFPAMPPCAKSTYGSMRRPPAGRVAMTPDARPNTECTGVGAESHCRLQAYHTGTAGIVGV